MGGRAKTPMVAFIAERLRDAGERPAILSRGYARQASSDALVIVRDAAGLRADLARAGDEPLMLARRLDGVVVISGADRYAAGRLAESRFGCTVHVLDDGFQHVRLHRDVDIVLVAQDDLARPWTLPLGRLREPVDALRHADAVVALDDAQVGPVAGTARVWRARRRLERARLAEPPGGSIEPPPGPVLAVAGIAQPARFFADLRAAGWSVARELPFRDHHAYTREDLEEVLRCARDAAAGLIVTTEKDLVRLLRFRPFPVPVAYVPMTLSIDDGDSFVAWLADAVRRARMAA